MDKINGHDKDYIDNTPRKFVTVPQPEQDIEIHVHKHCTLRNVSTETWVLLLT